MESNYEWFKTKALFQSGQRNQEHHLKPELRGTSHAKSKSRSQTLQTGRKERESGEGKGREGKGTEGKEEVEEEERL